MKKLRILKSIFERGIIAKCLFGDFYIDIQCINKIKVFLNSLTYQTFYIQLHINKETCTYKYTYMIKIRIIYKNKHAGH